MQPGNPGQPPGSGFGPPQHGGFGQPFPQQPGQPAQPGHGAPQPGYGAPQGGQPAGFGSPPSAFPGQPAGYGSPPNAFPGQPAGLEGQPGAFGSPPGAFGSPPGGFGAQPGAFGSQPGGFGPPQPAAPPARKLGIFDSVPCPHCGSAMRSSAGYGASAGRVFGGLVGWLLITAIASKYYCPQHGEVPTDARPADHRSTVTMRRVLMGGGALSLLVLVFGCIIFSAALRSY